MPSVLPTVLYHPFLLLLSTFILPSSLPSSVRAECYYPNGTLEPSPVYQPCPGSGSDTFAMCCASNLSSLPSATSTTSTTPTTFQSFPTNDDHTPPRESSDQKRRVGIGVGVGVGGSGALAAVVSAMCIRRKKRRRQRELKEGESRRDLSQEMDGEGKVAEFDGEGLAAELEADLTMWGGELDATERYEELEGRPVQAELG
ncbi:MAG: hypothetical protein Q9208_004167 [Pyrenodesmia sp. 3 TL-2023]